MTPSQVIAEVRKLINDSRTPLRFSDSDLLGFVNLTLQRIALLRPDLFTFLGNISTTPNTTVQRLPDNAVRLIDIFAVVNGAAIKEVDREVLDMTLPSWRAEASGTPVNFMRHPRNPTAYFLYPAPSSGVVLLAEYVRAPATVALSSTIPDLPDAYLSAVVDGTVALAESIDDEHVNSGRAKLFLEAFNQSLGVGLQAREVTDDDRAGMDVKRIS